MRTDKYSIHILSIHARYICLYILLFVSFNGCSPPDLCNVPSVYSIFVTCWYYICLSNRSYSVVRPNVADAYDSIIRSINYKQQKVHNNM